MTAKRDMKFGKICGGEDLKAPCVDPKINSDSCVKRMQIKFIPRYFLKGANYFNLTFKRSISLQSISKVKYKTIFTVSSLTIRTFNALFQLLTGIHLDY